MGNKIIHKSLLIFTFLFILLSINTTSAQQENIRFYHEIDTNLTIFEKCRIDGAVCDSDFNCNITILSPSQELIIDNREMTRGTTYFNFSLNTTSVTPNGVFETTVDCVDVNDNSSGSNTFFYQITPNGSVPMGTAQSVIAFLSIFMISSIGLVCLSLSYKINDNWISLAFLSFAIMLMIFAFGMILNILELSFGTFGTIIGNYSALYITFIALGSVGVIGLIIYLIVFALKLYWQGRGLAYDGID